MRKEIYKLLICLTAVMLALLMPVSVFADSTEGSGSCYFNGKKIVSDFSDGEIAEQVSNLQPGDDVTFTVDYTNRHSEKTDWYMENSVLQTLEKTREAKKVEGTGAAENGGYTYELIHTDAKGKKHVLFSSDEVGGEEKPANMQGLEQATNALDDWFYLETLDEGQSGELTLKVAFEGETEVNDYMDTKGGLELKFAVELTSKDKPGTPGKPGSGTTSGVDTGDRSRLMFWTAIEMMAGLLFLVLAVLSIRRDRREASDEEA